MRETIDNSIISEWITSVIPTHNNVAPVATKLAGTAVLFSSTSGSEIRFTASSNDTASRIDAIEALGRNLGARRSATQGKLSTNSLLYRTLIEKKYRQGDDHCIIFRANVSQAAHRLAILRQSFRDRMPIAVTAKLDHIDCIVATAEVGDMMDEFEVRARLAHNGPGAIDIKESVVVQDDVGLAGFILVGKTGVIASRELQIRWVAPRCRQNPLVNLALLSECLDRAAIAGVTSAFFEANPKRHAETLLVAKTLGAEKCGVTVAFSRDL